MAITVTADFIEFVDFEIASVTDGNVFRGMDPVAAHRDAAHTVLASMARVVPDTYAQYVEAMRTH